MGLDQTSSCAETNQHISSKQSIDRGATCLPVMHTSGSQEHTPLQAASMYMELRPEGGARIHKAMCTAMDRTSSKPLSIEEHSPCSHEHSSTYDSEPFGRWAPLSAAF